MTAQIIRPVFGSRPRQIEEISRPTEMTQAHLRAVETLRLTGLAAMNGNKQAREVLGMYSSLTGEPYIAKAASKFLAAIDRSIVVTPCDVEPDGAA